MQANEIQAELSWDARCRLGEGAVWSAADASLYFVDILGSQVLAHTPATGLQRRWPMPQKMGWLLPRRAGGWVAGFAEGVAALMLEPAPKIDWLHRLHAPESPLRLNDAGVDPAGRLWFGSLNQADENRPDGVFYRWAAGAAPEPVDHGYCVTNGPVWSLDGCTLYHADSALRVIYAFDAAADGTLSNKRRWVEFDASEGYPDGMTIDANGDLWVAHWGGGRVTRRDAAGRVLQTVRVAAPQVSNVAFGGPGLADLYITTARRGMDAAALATAPHAGGLFIARGAGCGRLVDAFAG